MEMKGMTKIALRAPDLLEEAFGYRKSNARYVAFYWGGGDELYCTDSNGYGGTIDHYAWLAMMRHPLGIVFYGYKFGGSDYDAEHWLLLDRETRELWAGRVDDVRHFIESFIPRSEPVEMTKEEWDEFSQNLMEQLRNSAPQPATIDIMALIKQEHENVQRLETWLDQRLREVLEEMESVSDLSEGWQIWLMAARAHFERKTTEDVICH